MEVIFGTCCLSYGSTDDLLLKNLPEEDGEDENSLVFVLYELSTWSDSIEFLGLAK